MHETLKLTNSYCKTYFETHKNVKANKMKDIKQLTTL